MTALAAKIDRTVLPGAATSGGGTQVFDYAVPTDRVTYIYARVIGSHLTAAHVDKGLGLFAMCVVKNNNGTTSFCTAASGSTNPLNSNTAGLAAAATQAYDDNFSTSTAVFTVTGALARLTVTNNGSVNADLNCFFEVYISGSA